MKSGEVHYEVRKGDKCCWNCDNFVREDNRFLGFCLLKNTSKDSNQEACKKFYERNEEMN